MNRSAPKFRPKAAPKGLRPKLFLGCEICSASFDRHAEDVRVVSVVVAELEFRDVQVQILLAHLM
jgi:hypothetical protein